jgi:DNA mismatch repair ATPase MutL
MTILSADNGTSGAIAVLSEKGAIYIETPIKKEQSYTKKKQIISRIDYNALYSFVFKFAKETPVIVMERPCVNPGRFKTTISAIRALEATCIVLEQLGLDYKVIDSKRWQNELLPNVKGSENLKKASKELGIMLFPEHKELIEKHKDADALLIATWVSNMIKRGDEI